MLLSVDLRDIIEKGDIERVEELLAGERAKVLLTQTYGGSDGGIDTSGLFSGTLPLQHAARLGEGLLKPVLEALTVISSPNLC